jgi:hypothetical protein
MSSRVHRVTQRNTYTLKNARKASRKGRVTEQDVQEMQRAP